MPKKKVTPKKKSPKKDLVCDFNGVCRIPGEFGEYQVKNKDYKHSRETAKSHEVHRMSDLSWRIFRIMGEFTQGFQFLAQFTNEVTVFGSARLKPGTKWFEEAVKFGKLCAKGGFPVITGGGPGIMEAANKGAFEGKGESIGINIQLPFEQRINPYVKKSIGFYYFFTRKVMLASSAQAYIYFPGGFGTADEFFEMVTLVQTGKMQPLPIVCVGKEFWEPCLHWMNKMIDMKTINAEDKKLFHVVDTAEEAYKLIKNSKERTIF